jgi:hypothetical protein
MKTSELTGAALNWAVATLMDLDIEIKYGVVHVDDDEVFMADLDWNIVGIIIEREKIATNYSAKRDCWFAENFLETCAEAGPTPLIAALRCYVASKLGDEVDIPEELT